MPPIATKSVSTASPPPDAELLQLLKSSCCAALSFAVSGADELDDRRIGMSAEDNLDVAQLLVNQIEFANVVIVNKTDLLSKIS